MATAEGEMLELTDTVNFRKKARSKMINYYSSQCKKVSSMSGLEWNIIQLLNSLSPDTV